MFVYKRCPSLWPALLDLFNSCWSCQSIPQLWKKAVIKLIPKGTTLDNCSDMSNFRPIAVTPTVGKLYTNIIKDRWSKFMIENLYWPTDTQKAFLSGVPGCLKHQFLLMEALKDARKRQI